MTTYTTSEVLSIAGLSPQKSSASLTDNVGGARATSALVVPVGGPVDYTFVDGLTPAAGKCIRLLQGVPQFVIGYDNIKNATYFNTDGATLTLYIQYAYGL